MLVKCVWSRFGVLFCWIRKSFVESLLNQPVGPPPPSSHWRAQFIALPLSTYGLVSSLMMGWDDVTILLPSHPISTNWWGSSQPGICRDIKRVHENLHQCMWTPLRTLVSTSTCVYASMPWGVSSRLKRQHPIVILVRAITMILRAITTSTASNDGWNLGLIDCMISSTPFY